MLALLGAEPPKAVGGRKKMLGIGVKFWEIGVKNMLDAGRHPQAFLSTEHKGNLGNLSAIGRHPITVFLKGNFVYIQVCAPL